MIFFNRLGIGLALLTALFAVIRLKYWPEWSKWLVLFLGGSSLLGLAQIFLNRRGVASAWVLTLWTGFSALSLLSVFAEASHPRLRQGLHVIKWVTVLGWATWCFGNPKILLASFLPHLPFAMIAIFFAGIALGSSVQIGDGSAFWIGMAGLLSQSIDLLMFLAIRGDFGISYEGMRLCWTIRNASWCIVYMFFFLAFKCQSRSLLPSRA